MNWRPIKTAPKDGSDVLVLIDCAGVSIVHIAWYRGREEWESSGQYAGGWDTFDDWEGWWSYTRNSISEEKLMAPTHWMPLPAGPEQEK